MEPEQNITGRAARHQINLSAPVIITVIDNSTGEEKYLVLQGEVLNISLSGLALIIAGEDFQEPRKLGDNLILRLMLPLRTESIELEAMPVRYKLLSGSAEEGKILVGVQITNMNGRDRIVFIDFICECEN